MPSFTRPDTKQQQKRSRVHILNQATFCMSAHVPLTKSLNVSFLQGSEPSEESGSEEDVPSVRRMLKLQQAESDEASEDEADAKVLKAQSRAEALHDSAAPSHALVEQEVINFHTCLKLCVY